MQLTAPDEVDATPDRLTMLIAPLHLTGFPTVKGVAVQKHAGLRECQRVREARSKLPGREFTIAGGDSMSALSLYVQTTDTTTGCLRTFLVKA